MEQEKKEGWHLGKEIPITLIFLILVQSAGGFWWAATLTNKVDNLTSQIADLKAGSYSKVEANKDLSLINYKIDQLSSRVMILEAKKK